MEKDILQKIIEAANLAPSGGNSQPWEFSIQGKMLIFDSLPQKDHPVFNYRSRGTLIAHGAALENISIASAVHGYRAIFDNVLSPNIRTIISFVPGEKNIETEELYKAIPNRHSNRTRYKERPLTDQENLYIFKEITRFVDCRIVTLDRRVDMLLAAQELAHDAPINFGNKMLHNLAYKELVWTREEEAVRGGLYIRTLEIGEKQEKPVRLMSKWLIARIFKSIGLFKKIYQSNVIRGASGSLIGAIAVSDNDEAFIHAGHILQNIWLRAVHKKLSLHVLAGLVFLWQYENLGGNHILSSIDRNLINNAYKNLKEIFSVKDSELIGITFRIGEAGSPMAVSHKRDPKIVEN